MPRKKDFWELADSTILGRTKKAELLKIARSEHQQAQALRAQIEAYTKQLETENQLIEQLRLERNQDGEIHRQVLENLLQVFEQQQQNHEQELSRLQDAAKNWEKVAQDYEDVIVTQRTELSTLQSIVQQIKRFAQLPPFEAGQAFIRWLFVTKADLSEPCLSCGEIIASPDYRFCPHCGARRKISVNS
jgi:uncharacterized protein YdiU (UPF0061 family)